jgi:hypothetical protein
MTRFLTALLIVFLGLTVSAKDIMTLDGTFYRNVKVLRKNSIGIEILHSGGASFVKFKEMPQHIRKEFGYNPDVEKKILKRKIEKFRKKLSALEKKIPLGRINKYEHEGTEYFLYIPLSAKELPIHKLPLLVSVHGTNRYAEYFTEVFVSAAEKYGVAILAPLFDEETFPLYQYCMYPGNDLLLEKNKRIRSDLRLIDILRNAREKFPLIDTSRFYIFGFSGGAQFSIRFSALHPHVIIRGTAASAGSYLFPNEEKDYPIGIKNCKLYPHVKIKGFLDTPFCILVGEKDTETLLGVKALPEYKFQGDTRVARMKNFYNAMKNYARKIQSDFKMKKTTVPWVAHNFRPMVPYAENFLFEEED